MAMSEWREDPALVADLDAVPGTVSVWYGPPGGPPVWQRQADTTHYAASTMKVAVLAALHRAVEAGRLDLDQEVEVVNDFHSAAPGHPRFGCDRADDDETVVWEHLGRRMPLRWLAHRMIVRSSNLATNLVLARVGLAAVAEVWHLVGARHSVTVRGIDDAPARAAGLHNLVTAADLAALLSAVVTGADAAGGPGRPLAGPAARAAMRDTLLATEHRDDLAAGLPPGTRIAHKSGWVPGVRHGAGVVLPDDAPPYTLVVCTTSELPDREACEVVARVSAACWARRSARDLGRRAV